MNLEFDNKVLYNKLNIYFYNNIRLSLKTSNKIFIITKEDKFYEINIYNENIPSFVLFNDVSVIKSMEIEKLSKKNIIDLSYGFCHYIAWNDESKIFCWGNNCCGQIGNGKRDEVENTKELANALKNTSDDFITSHIFGNHQNEAQLNVLLSDTDIDVIKCGNWHSLALTKSGEVFVWGLTSREGNIEEMCSLSPTKLDNFDGERVTMISCGYKHSIALTESGRVFSWGENSYGQLGRVKEIYSIIPKIIGLKNVSIQKISCGKYHSLLLSNDGVIYAFGDNRSGQIGNGSKDKHHMTPVKLTHTNKFKDIASNFMEDISVSFSIEGNFYVWGKCGEDVHFTPFQTNYTSFNEVFSNYTQIQYKRSEALMNFNDLLFRYGYYKSEFKEIDKIGEGSFGKVLRVKDQNEDKFAIKCVKPKAGNKNYFLREFENYVKVNKFESKYYVKLIDAWFENKTNNDENKTKELSLYIKMELCDKTLDDVMNEIHREFLRPEDKILSPIGYYLMSDIFIEILRGVHCLHQHNIIHRDLNLENILLKLKRNGDILVKIADFGLSVLHEYTKTHTQDKGTPKFIAPEVSITENYDIKVDIYSLGIILEYLFKIDPTKAYQVDSDQDCKLLHKYNQAVELYSRMTNNVPSKRPDCEEMLKSMDLWALNDDDFDSANGNGFDLENERKIVLDSKLEEEKSFLHSILESKFLAIKLKMMNKKETSVLKTLDLNEKDPDFIRKFLAHLKLEEIIHSKMRSNLVDSMIVILRKYSDSIEIQQNALKTIASLFYSIEKGSIERLNPEQLVKVINITLTAMRLYPKDEQLQRSALIILYSKQILENLSSEKYTCTKLVMDTLVNFKKTDMNLMASVICTTHLKKLSIEVRSDLGSNNAYIKTLLEIIKSRVHFYSYFYLIENTLTFLVNFLVDSLNNCSIFMKLGGLDVCFNLLETFIGNEDIEFRILGLLYNLAEFPCFKKDFIKAEFIELLRNLIYSANINLGFLGVGIFAQIFHVGIEFGMSQFNIISENLMEIFSVWKNLEEVCVSFSSFSTFKPLLESSTSPAVQYWAVWTMHHFCSKNKKYGELITREVGIQSLTELQENSKTDQSVISLCRETLFLLEIKKSHTASQLGNLEH